MDIISYIQNKVRVPITTESVEVILLDRDIDMYQEAEDIPLRKRELLYADALMHLYTSASSSGGETTQHGGFMHKSGGESMNRIYRYKRLANEIYRKYEDKKFDGTGVIEWTDNDI